MTIKNNILLDMQRAMIFSLMQINSDFSERAKEHDLAIDDIVFNLGSASTSVFYEMIRDVGQPLGKITESQINELKHYLASYNHGFNIKLNILSDTELLNNTELVKIEINDRPEPKKSI